MRSNQGKLRGKVVQNVDPLMLGRLIVHVPAVSELPLANWAMPCVPYAGKGVGFFALPPLGANVWVEFEGGDPNLPIWTGCFWGTGEAPATPAVPTTKLLKTALATLKIDDLACELKLELSTPSGKFLIVADPQGITLSTATASVSLTPQKIALKCEPSSVEVAPQGVSAANGTAALDLAPSQVSLRNSTAAVQLTPAAASVKNGEAMCVDIAPTSVSINKGALEVT